MARTFRIKINVKKGIEAGTGLGDIISVHKTDRSAEQLKSIAIVGRNLIRLGLLSAKIGETETVEDKLALAAIGSFAFGINALTQSLIQSRISKVEAQTLAIVKANKIDLQEIETEALKTFFGDKGLSYTTEEIERFRTQAELGYVNEFSGERQRFRLIGQKQTRKVATFVGITSGITEVGVGLAVNQFASIVQTFTTQAKISRDRQQIGFSQRLKGIRTVGRF